MCETQRKTTTKKIRGTLSGNGLTDVNILDSKDWTVTVSRPTYAEEPSR